MTTVEDTHFLELRRKLKAYIISPFYKSTFWKDPMPKSAYEAKQVYSDICL